MVVWTGLATSIPEGNYARTPSRSGIPVKRHIRDEARVVDADCRGDWGVVLFNHVDGQFRIQKGDRIAQLIFEKITANIVEKVE